MAEVLIIDSSITIVLGLPLAIVLREPVTMPAFSPQWFGVLLYAVISLMAALLTINGFRHLQAQTGSLVLLLEPVFATFFGWLFYKEVLTVSVMVGGVFILFGAALPNLKSIKLKLNKL